MAKKREQPEITYSRYGMTITKTKDGFTELKGFNFNKPGETLIFPTPPEDSRGHCYRGIIFDDPFSDIFFK